MSQDREVAPTAADAFREMLKFEVSPRLRELGFKGSSGRYELPSTTHWQLVATQVDGRLTTPRNARFTVNLAVHSRWLWDQAREENPRRPQKPTASTQYGGWTGVQSRLGHLMPQRRDTWWEIERGLGTLPLAEALVAAITDFGMAWLAEAATLNSADDFRAFAAKNRATWLPQ